MPANQFQPFSTGGTANVEDLATWLASTTLTNGFVAGYAKSEEANRAIRQPSFIGSGWAEWVFEELSAAEDILDNGDRARWVSQIDRALRKLIQSMIRIKQTGTAQVYVSGVSGNDANDGLTTGTPFKTIQKAVNYMLSNIDLGPNSAYISIEGGQTYNEGIQIGSSPMGLLGLGYWQMLSYNGLVSIVGPSGYALNLSGGAQLVLNGNFLLSCLSSSAGPNGVVCSISGSRFGIAGSGTTFGNSPGCKHLYAANGGEINNASGQGSYNVGGGADFHLYAGQNGIITMQAGGIYGPKAINLSGTPNFAVAYATAVGGGSITHIGPTFTGTAASGIKYVAQLNATINTQGAGASYFPGTVAGSVSTGGQYV
jgi:hypothetical protein